MQKAFKLEMAQPDFNGAKIAKLANKTEELRIILRCDVLKIIGIAYFFAAGLVSIYAADPQVIIQPGLRGPGGGNALAG